ncbi:MAG: regulatory protein RecX [Balneolaceae bacterium]
MIRSNPNSPTDPPVDLPVEVTSVHVQKKRSDRISLFHDKQFLIGLSESVRQSFKIGAGTQLTRSLWDQICRAEERQETRDHLLRLLGRRSHTRTELFRKGRQKGGDSELLEEELDRLEEQGYLDNAEFAKQFVHDKLHLRGWGPRKIQGELRRRGVSSGRAAEAVRRESDTLDLTRICVDLALKRRGHFLREEDVFRRRQKIAAWLQRKGYSRESITAAMPEILERLDESTHHS